MSDVDYIAVLRTAHQFGIDHGHSAHLDAARLAQQAEASGEIDKAEFWKAVCAALTPRE